MWYKKLLCTLSICFAGSTLLQGSALQNLFADHTDTNATLQRRQEIIASKMNFARGMQLTGGLGLAGYFGYAVKGKLQQQPLSFLFPKKHTAGASTALVTGLLGWYWHKSMKTQMLRVIKQQKRVAKRAAADAEAQRLEEEAQAAAEQRRLLQLEADRLADIEAERQAAADRDRLAAEQKASAAAKAKADRAAAEQELAAQRERDRKFEEEAQENLRKIREQQAHAARLQREAAERQRLEAERQAVEAAAAAARQRLEADRVEAENRARLAAEQKAKEDKEQNDEFEHRRAEVRRLALERRALEDQQHARAAAEQKAKDEADKKTAEAKVTAEQKRLDQAKILLEAFDPILKDCQAIAREFYQAAQIEQTKQPDDLLDLLLSAKNLRQLATMADMYNKNQTPKDNDRDHINPDVLIAMDHDILVIFRSINMDTPNIPILAYNNRFKTMIQTMQEHFEMREKADAHLTRELETFRKDLAKRPRVTPEEKKA